MTEEMKAQIQLEVFATMEKRLQSKFQSVEENQRAMGHKIDLMHDDILILKETTTSTLNQALKTNGRVSGHDMEFKAQESWNSRVLGITIGAGACITVVIGLISYIFMTNNAQIINSLDKHIEQTR